MNGSHGVAERLVEAAIGPRAADMTTHPIIPTAALDDRLGFRLILWTISASTEEPQ
jgi:hypothetical protein